MDARETQLTAVQSVLAEIAERLGNLGNAVVLVGGALPLIACERPRDHVGTLDIDLVVSQTRSPVPVRARLLLADFREEGGGTRFVKNVAHDGQHIAVPVDLLAGIGAKRTGRGGIAAVGDAKAVSLRGCELANTHFETVDVGGAPLSIASPACFLAMKLLAARDRGGSRADKDFYDIAFYARNYRRGAAAIAADLAAAPEPAIAEAASMLEAAFASPDALGPRSVARFLGAGDDAARQAFLALAPVLSLYRNSEYRTMQ